MREDYLTRSVMKELERSGQQKLFETNTKKTTILPGETDIERIKRQSKEFNEMVEEGFF